MMTSTILRTATRFLMPLLLLFAVFLLLRGHNEPGGGFVAGLVVSAAFVLYSIDSGIPACRRALLVNPSRLLGVGLLIALTSGVPALVVGRPYMTSLWTSIGVPPATFDVGTPMLFDVGVCLAVIGVVLTIAFTLIDVVLTED
jgi:multicomponent Na+:H+ antiporter subunit B